MKKIIPLIFFSLLLFLFFLPADFALSAAVTECVFNEDCGENQVCRRGKCIKSPELEIAYPEIPGAITPKVVASGLPNYVKYIFQLSVVIIGFIIFAVMVYSGVRYLTSVGDPAKMSDAREGIFSAFLGAIILLSAFILFNTINPQLTILEPPKLDLLGGKITPGAYICNHQIDASLLGETLDNYIMKDKPGRLTEEEQREQIRATIKMRQLMFPPDDKNKVCYLVGTSRSLDFTMKRGNAMFIIPTDKIINNKHTPIYEYGIVLHEKDNFKGQCDYYPKEESNLLYTTYENEGGHNIKNYKFESYFNSAKSVTLFKRPAKRPPDDAQGVILYNCVIWNQAASMCPDGKLPTEEEGLFGFYYKPGGQTDIDFADQARLNLDDLDKNARSLWIHPQGSYFALLFEGDKKFEGNCVLVSARDNYLLDNGLGLCGAGCGVSRRFLPSWGRSFIFGGEDAVRCAPCLRSMIVIRGEIL